MTPVSEDRSGSGSGTGTGAHQKRSSVACRRCRRLRTKCVQDGGKLPCNPCKKAGSIQSRSCAFSDRGDNADRHYRIKRRSDVDALISPRQPQPPNQDGNEPSIAYQHTPPREPAPESQGALRVHLATYSSCKIWNLLPPHDELIHGCRVFLTTCLQVGFIPKALFLERLNSGPESVEVFLLLSMLSISARFTPSLCGRFGGSKPASDFFLDLAYAMVPYEMWKTSLENTQAFFLLGMADWGRGERDKSSINMGISVRMAGMLRLHREETYQLGADANADDVVNAESARRTFWVIQNHDNLYTQQHLPASFAKADITTLLPCDESDFAFGNMPPSRAALAGTAPALKDSSLISLPRRSLFATLIQTHDLWGMIARDAYDEAGNSTLTVRPWDRDSDLSRAATILADWEANIPKNHRWSAWNLRGFKAEKVDLAYLSIVTIARLNNIVLRRVYLRHMTKQLLDRDHSQTPAPAGFWQTLSDDLFSNVWQLYEAIDVWFSLRSQEDGFPAILAFCTYVCGSLACYIYRWPQLCPNLEPSPEVVVRRSLEILVIFEEKWSTATDWTTTLRNVMNKIPHAGGTHDTTIVSTQEEIFNAESPVVNSKTSQQCGQYNNMVHKDYSSDQAYASGDRNHQSIVEQAVDQTRLQPEQVVHPGTHGMMATGDPGRDSSRILPDDLRYPDTDQGQGQHPQALQAISPDSSVIALFQEPMDANFADLVQGYLHFSWAG